MNNNFAEFMLTSASLAGYSLNAYLDLDGNEHSIKDRKDEHGNPIKRRFKFNHNMRVLRVPLAQKEIIEFLRNAPECEGSPNNTGQQCYFKEVNNERDAEKIVEIEGERIMAQTLAYNLKGQDLADVALLCGTNSSNESMQRKKVLDYSGSNPKGFVALVSSPDVKTRSLVRRALEQGLVTKKGFIYMWSDVHLGNDEDSAVKFLMKDKKIAKAIEEKLK